MMKRIIAILLIVVSFCITEESQAQLWKTRKQKEAAAKKASKPKLSNYEKLFKDKTVETAKGLMTIHKVADKIYVEFPLSLLSRDMALTSSIESTSDAGEGYVGQLGGRVFRMHFTLQDSTLQARTSILSVPINSSGDQSIDQALEHSTTPAIYKTFKVLAYTPDSSAVVVDMKKMLFESSTFTKPFPANASNSYYGFVTRSHKMQNELSKVLGVSASQSNIAVRGEMSFRVDHVLMGAYPMYDDVPLTAVINKMLVVLPQSPMRPRVADSRVGISPILKSDFEHAGSGVKATRFARRWKIEPADEQTHRTGGMSEVVKPVVFYMDSLLPQAWKQYVKEGVLEWNKAFEKIGLKNALRVEEFPTDSTFNANDFSSTTIRYSPTWINAPQVTVQADARTGEILNASIGIGGNMASLAQGERAVSTMAADPRVRKAELPIDLMGEMVKRNIMQAVGEALGFSRNLAASYAYPTDSLRSATFTAQHGISSSVMDEVVCNRVATEEDVKRGVKLINNSIGDYDYFAVKWLYKPVYDRNYKQEVVVLDQWIAEQNHKPFGQTYIRPQGAYPADPRIAMEGLSNDYILEMKYTMVNLRKSFDNYYEWFAEGDKDMKMRNRMYNYLFDNYSSGYGRVISYIGGVYLNDVREGEGESFETVSKAKQKEALAYAIELMKDVSWLENRYTTQSDIADNRVEKCRFDMFGGLFARLGYVEVAAQYSADPYTANEYLDDIYKVVWSKTLTGKNVDYIEQQVQIAFLNSILNVSTVTGQVGTFKVQSTKGITLRDEPATQDVAMIKTALVASRTNDGIMPDQVSGFGQIRGMKAESVNVSAHYYSLLLRMQEMLTTAEAKSGGNQKKHYTMLLYKIKKALDID